MLNMAFGGQLLFCYCLIGAVLLIGTKALSSNDTRILGVCSRPNLPPKARIRFASPEKVKFAENETIYVLCEEHQFPHHTQKRLCHHGKWKGEQTRCGKSVKSDINKLKAFKCSDPNIPLLSLELNQTEETPYPLPQNSFHFTRVDEKIVLSVFGSNCYRWLVEFDQRIEISFLLIDINAPKLNGTKSDPPKLDVTVKHRTCKIQHVSYQLIESDEVYGNYFFCDLNVSTNSSTNQTEQYKTDYLMVDVQTSSVRTIGLEAVFVGKTYKKQVGHRKLITDCGKVEIQRTGVMEQVELGYVQVSCNSSFFDASADTNNQYRYTCDANGVWQGKWPNCLPKKTCTKEEISHDLDSSVIIEQIGNVYYSNSSQWYAIDHSWVRYACANLEGIMVGKHERLCKNGIWSNKVPHCTQDIKSSSVAITIIIVILVVLITVFSLIVYLSIQFHTRKINRTLETTKNEMEANALNKQFAQEYYTDIGLETIYEDCKEMYSTPTYEISDDVRYEIEPRYPNEPEYLTMTEGTRKQVTATYSNEVDIYQNHVSS